MKSAKNIENIDDNKHIGLLVSTYGAYNTVRYIVHKLNKQSTRAQMALDAGNQSAALATLSAIHSLINDLAILTNDAKVQSQIDTAAQPTRK